MSDYHRHDISDQFWAKIAPHLPGSGNGKRGRPAEDNRRFINAVCWVLRTGAPWRDLPPDYGGWKNTHRRFCRWRDRGVFEELLEYFSADADFEWFMIDATHIKVHPHAAGAKGETRIWPKPKVDLTPKFTLALTPMACLPASL